MQGNAPVDRLGGFPKSILLRFATGGIISQPVPIVVGPLRPVEPVGHTPAARILIGLTIGHDEHRWTRTVTAVALVIWVAGIADQHFACFENPVAHRRPAIILASLTTTLHRVERGIVVGNRIGRDIVVNFTIVEIKFLFSPLPITNQSYFVTKIEFSKEIEEQAGAILHRVKRIVGRSPQVFGIVASKTLLLHVIHQRTVAVTLLVCTTLVFHVRNIAVPQRVARGVARLVLLLAARISARLGERILAGTVRIVFVESQLATDRTGLAGRSVGSIVGINASETAGRKF